MLISEQTWSNLISYTEYFDTYLHTYVLERVDFLHKIAYIGNALRLILNNFA